MDVQAGESTHSGCMLSTQECGLSIWDWCHVGPMWVHSCAHMHDSMAQACMRSECMCPCAGANLAYIVSACSSCHRPISVLGKLPFMFAATVSSGLLLVGSP